MKLTVSRWTDFDQICVKIIIVLSYFKIKNDQSRFFGNWK